MNYHWNWAIFGEMSPDGVHSYWQTLLSGFGWTVATSLTAWLMALALRVVLPPLASEFLNIIKNSSVALTIGLMELTASARAIQEFSFQVFEAFSAATLIYVAANLLVVWLMHALERRLALPGTLGGAR